MEKSKSQIFLNFFIFYIAWWITPFLITKGFSSAGLIICSSLFIAHFIFLSDRKFSDLLKVIPITLTLCASDFIMKLSNMAFHLSTDVLVMLLGINLVLSTTFSYGFSLITNKRIYQFILGAIIGPVTYFNASKLGLIELYEPFIIYYIIHVTLGMITIPACFYIEKNLKGLSYDKKSFGNLRRKPMG